MQLLPSTQFLLPHVFAFSTLLASAACSGGSGGGAAPNTGGGDPAQVDAAGTWTITETITQASSPCQDEVGTSETYQVFVQQTGRQLVVTTPAGVFNGSISSTGQAGWTASYPEGAGTTTIGSMALTISADSLSGTAEWSLVNGPFACGGRMTITGVRTAAGLLATGSASVLVDSLDLKEWFGSDGIAAYATPEGDSPQWREVCWDGDVIDAVLSDGDWRFAVGPYDGDTEFLEELPTDALELANPLRVRDGAHTVRFTDSAADWIPVR